MKKNRWNRVMTLFAILGVLVMSSAWGYGDGQGRRANDTRGEFHECYYLNLTDSQQDQIKAMRVTFMKEMTPMRNNMGIKIAELKAASVGDNVDSKAVNKLMDEIGVMRTNMAKKQFANKQKVRSVLTEEQKVMFDARSGQGNRGGCQGMNQGMRQGRQGAQGNNNNGSRGQGQGRGARGFGNIGMQ